jgi:glyoxylase-like metal-dependent hydrolase (beta-lactamase superfamily II)
MAEPAPPAPPVVPSGFHVVHLVTDREGHTHIEELDPRQASESLAYASIAGTGQSCRSWSRRVSAMRGRIACAAAVWGLMLAGAAPAQDIDPGPVKIEAQRLSPRLYFLRGSGGNMALFTGSEGAVLVDSEYAALAPKIRAAIAALTPRPVRFLINTHCHYDHWGANAAFERQGTLIIAQQNTRARLTGPQEIALFGTHTPAALPEALPTVTFAEAMTLYLEGERIELVHASAHTDGDAIVYFRDANVVHTGDVLIVGSYPFIDEGAGGSIDGMIDATAAIIARTDARTRFIPGHGPLASYADVVAYHEMLATVRGRVADLIQAGDSVEQVVAARPTLQFDARYLGTFLKTPDPWVERVDADLRRAGVAAPQVH